MKYVLYIKNTCPYCIRAVEFLESEGQNFKAINFDHDQEGTLSEIKEAYGWPSVPMVFEIDEHINFIGGCEDLIAHLRK